MTDGCDKAAYLKKNLNDNVDGHDGELAGLGELKLFEMSHRVPLEQGLGHEGLVEIRKKLKKENFNLRSF
jgi:hypothetical protein